MNREIQRFRGIFCVQGRGGAMGKRSAAGVSNGGGVQEGLVRRGRYTWKIGRQRAGCGARLLPCSLLLRNPRLRRVVD